MQVFSGASPGNVSIGNDCERMKIILFCFNNQATSSVWYTWTNEVTAFVKRSIDYYPGIVFQITANCGCLYSRDTILRLQFIDQGEQLDQIVVTKSNYEFLALKARYFEKVSTWCDPKSPVYEFVLPHPEVIDSIWSNPISQGDSLSPKDALSLS